MATTGKVNVEDGEALAEFEKMTRTSSPGVVREYSSQLYALLFKNFTLFKRNHFASLVHLLAPMLMVVLFGVIIKVTEITTVELDPEAIVTLGAGEDGRLPKCAVFDTFGGRFGFGRKVPNADCVTVAYSPSNADTDALMQRVASQNGLSFSQDFQSFASAAAVEAFIESGSDVVMASIVFPDDGVLFKDVAASIELDGDATSTVVPYEIWYNKTVLDFGFLENAGFDTLSLDTDAQYASFVMLVQHAVNQALVAEHTGSSTSSMRVSIKPFPFSIADGGREAGNDGGDILQIEAFGSVFYLLGIMISFIVTLRQIVAEKESKILDALRMMGLYESAYWLSWMVYYVFVMFLSATLMVLAGLAFDIPAFTNTDLVWVFLVFYLYLMAMSAFAMALSSLLPNTKTAIMVGFLFLTIAVFFQLFVSLKVFNLITIMYSPYRLSTAGLNAINLYPPLLFSKIDAGMYSYTRERPFINNDGEIDTLRYQYTFDIAAESPHQYYDTYLAQSIDFNVPFADTCNPDLNSGDPNADLCYKQETFCNDGGDNFINSGGQFVYVGPCIEDLCTPPWAATVDQDTCLGLGATFNTGLSPGHSFYDPFSTTRCDCTFEIPSDRESLNRMFGSVLLWVFMAWYLGQVFTFGHGRAEAPWFILTPWYWLGSMGFRNPFDSNNAKPSGKGKINQDDDVAQDEERVLSGELDQDPSFPVVIKNIVKDFGSSMPCGGKKFRAVDGISLGLREGELFCLLGHNGAGKTTAINTLVGMQALSGGDAKVYGNSVRSNMASIRHDLGVCPQHDILWNELSSTEHLYFYGKFQGMSGSQIKQQGGALLRQVKLDKLTRPAGNYSGGMKRRLSMTIAALGNKRVVLLDEPTTGLDPQNQRHVWDMINGLKKDRVVILTTHLMEEADTLGDRIGIMSEGRLVALGDSLHLKRKFGGNYKVTISPASDDVRGVLQDNVLKIAPGAIVEGTPLMPGSGPMTYRIPQASFGEAPALFRWVESEIDKGRVKDSLSLSQTSLEDIFISLDENHREAAGMQAQAVVANAAGTEDVPVAKEVGHLEAMSGDVKLSNSFRKQARGLFRKSLVLQKRQRKTVCCQITIPLALIVLMWFIKFQIEESVGEDDGTSFNQDFSDCGECMTGELQQLNNILQGFSVSFSNDFLAEDPNFDSIPELQAAGLDVLVPNMISTFGSVSFFNPSQTQNDAPGSIAFFAPGNEIFDHCTTKSAGQTCADFASSGFGGGFSFPAARWFGFDTAIDAYDYSSFDNLNTYAPNGQTLGGNARIMVGAKSRALALQLGEQCLNGNGLLATTPISSSTRLTCSSGNFFSQTDMVPSATAGYDGTNADGPDGPCNFQDPFAALITNNFQANFDSHQTSTAGFLNNYPSRIVQSFASGEPGSDIRTFGSPALCDIRGFTSFSNLEASITNNPSDTPALNAISYRGQEAFKASTGDFAVPFPRTEAGEVAAKDTMGEVFPDAGFIFESLDTAAGRLAMDLHAYYNVDASDTSFCESGGSIFSYPHVKTLFAPSGGASFDDPCNFQDTRRPTSTAAGLDRATDSSQGIFGDPPKIVHMVNFVLNGLTTAMLRAATADPGSPLAGASDTIVTVGVRPMPFLENPDQDTFDLIQEINKIIGALMLPLATSFLLPVLVFHIVHEKEHRLRASMLMMGLRMKAYWFVQYAFDFVLVFTTLMVIYILGSALDITILSNHQFSVVLVVFFLWTNVMISFAFLVSVFFKRTRNANIVMYILVFFGVIANVNVNLIVFEETPFLPAPAWWVWFPLFTYYRAVFLMAGRSYFWEDMTAPDDEMTSLMSIMVLQIVVMFAAAAYLDLVIPKEYGTNRSPFFPIQDTWDFVKGLLGRRNGDGKSATQGKVDVEAGLSQRNLEIDEDDVEIDHDEDDVDVLEEMRLIKTNDPSVADAPIRVINLRKKFGNFVAVDGVFMHMADAGVTCLLGPNGAGKSTKINMLTGLYKPTSGTAFVGGYDITTDMHKVHRNIGVCPQHDVTWPELTVREHLLLYARLKGAPTGKEKAIVDEALRAVELTPHAHKRSRQLSGGQRRRLSIAISFMGNPSVVFLDEPTTGIDPATRLAIENLILTEKKKRCIVLTTHLMPEAERLSDSIAIMAHGRLKTIGTANALKAKYNQGFKLLVVVSDSSAATSFVTSQFRNASLESHVNAKMVFRFGVETKVSVADVFEVMRDHASANGIVDFGLRMTSLEEVFISIAESEEAKFGTA
ncbi:ABC transporter A family member 7 (ABC transporter ABCA.7) [Durusdinium trenchii]|uniref:ABC transporter A family member 7 (ABC transporter ABCA.7) n=1 Tax=Durusdinium trenchii TaxID=1381693 RepID=A0ABP0QW60_9DINO